MPRMVVVWCPDWPVVAAGSPPDRLTAVVHANRVVACSPAARVEGVRPGLRRREAQSRCPELELLAHDPARDAPRYHGGEPALVAAVTTAVHAALGPVGACQVGIADGTFAAALAARRAGAAGPRPSTGGPGTWDRGIVPPGESRAFLAPLPVGALDRPDLADLLVRLGLRTLGDLAALPRADLATRFGPEGARAARLAAGLDEHPRGARRPPPDLRVAAELDPPADRVDVAAFTAKTLADELVARLDRLGLACTRLRIEARTDRGETLSRVWRYDPVAPPPRPSGPDPVPRSASPAGDRGPGGPPGRMAAVMAERVRWQLDGWLTGRTGRLPGALTHLVLVADEVVPDRGRQLGFWGGETETAQRAARALARIQGLLGPEAVRTPHLRGGRDPAARVAFTLTPGEGPEAGGEHGGSRGSGPPPLNPLPTPGRPRRHGGGARVPDVPGLPRRMALAGPLPLDPPGGPGRGPTGSPGIGPAVVPGAVPWPGQVPAPAPAVVYAEPLPAEVVDAAGTTVAVDGRGLLGSPPTRVRVRGRAWSAITAWAGPWLVDERWWDPAAHRRLVRLQATTDQGAAYLLRLTAGDWWVEATYD